MSREIQAPNERAKEQLFGFQQGSSSRQEKNTRLYWDHRWRNLSPCYWKIFFQKSNYRYFYKTKYLYQQHRLRKNNELKQRNLEERFKSKEIVDLKLTIIEGMRNADALRETNAWEQIIVPAMKNHTLVTFVFTIAENQKNKPIAQNSQPKTDPFSPPFEPGRFITDLSSTHRLIANKYPIVKNHVLIVTSVFQEQTDPLNLDDFVSSYKVLLALNGILYFNSGPCSGASQPHKHLQVMPKFQEDSSGILTLIDKEAIRHDKPFKWHVFQFAHWIVPLPNFSQTDSDKEIGAKLEKLYLKLINKLKINTKVDSYNLIMNENWMMIVKRSKEYAFEGVSVNALGFMGNSIFYEWRV